MAIDNFDPNDFDFGISFEEAQVTQADVDAVQNSAVQDTVIASSNNIEHKLDSILAQLDFDEVRDVVEQAAQTKVENMARLILPLLYNLKKSPEKDTIRWPGRDTVIDAQIKKINAIIDG